MGTWFIYELLAVILCSARNYNCAELYNFTAGGVDLEAAESSARVNLSSPFFLDEKAYTSLYVNQDGSITFESPVSFSEEVDTLVKLGRRTAVVAPFWSDIDITLTGEVSYWLLQSSDENYFQFMNEVGIQSDNFSVVMATWSEVGHFNMSTDGNSFQVILGTNGTVSYIMLRYAAIDWTTPDPQPSSNAREAISGVASSRSLFYITGDLLSSTNANDPGVFLYQTTPTSILTASLDSTQAICLQGDVRLYVGQSDDYFTANNDYDSSFFVGGMEGSGLLRGRVEYCDRGSYVGICYDSSWDVKDATVVCRQLGFSPYGVVSVGVEFAGASYLNSPSIPYQIHSVNCNGTEDSINQCLLVNNSGLACQSSLSASVICQETSFVASDCLDGEVRLTGGVDNATGRVEVCSDSAWGSICRNSFGSLDAQVVCHQLGFLRDGATSLATQQFGDFVGPIFLDYLTCSGSEEALVNCSHVTGPLDCDRVVGVRCIDENECARNNSGCEHHCINQLPGFVCSCNPGFELNLDGKSCSDIDECTPMSNCSQECVNTNGSYFCQCRDNYILYNETFCRSCVNDEIRLIGGGSPSQGRVEICRDSVFHTVCDDFWDEREAQIICKQLGYNSSLGVVALRGAYFGPGSENRSILLDDLTCNGTESSLLMCSSANSSVVVPFSNDCSHDEDAAVICNVSSPCVNGSVTLEVSATRMPLIAPLKGNENALYGKNGVRAGRVDVCMNSMVGTICNAQWDNKDASVVCAQLGYSPYGALGVAADVFDDGSMVRDVFMSVSCAGNESNLLDCRTEPFSGINCPSSGVICQEPDTPREVCVDGDLRLQGGGAHVFGNLSLQGRVEICLNNAWGTVCDRLFGEEELRTICNQIIGVTYQGALILPSSSFTSGETAIFLSDLNCRGDEAALLTCPRRFHFPPGLVRSCDHSQDVGVLCPDIDECAMDKGGCDHICTNFAGSFNCSCRDGFRLADDGLKCNDIDECTEGLDSCHDNATCVNAESNYTCRCHQGFSGDGFNCSNVDECTVSSPCDTNAFCNDTFGGFICTCNDGYKGNGTSCTDIDECKKDPGICGFNAKCNNTMGNFTCSCLPGYNGTAGANCTDIDECSVAVSPCHGNAICNNTAPFFTCECEPGYSGNGFNCTDIDECLDKTDNCDSHANCTNTNGSFNCTCFPGYSKEKSINCSCDDGDIMLKNGKEVSFTEGRVEICYMNEYMSVCDDLWDVRDAQVVCRQLNFSGMSHLAVERAARLYEAGEGAILLDDIQCTGDESNLLQCNHSGIFKDDCTHSEDAGVVCGVECTGDVVRIVNSNPNERHVVKGSPLAGRVEICLSGQFRTICDDFWTKQEASLLCKELGFSEFGAVNLTGGVFQRSETATPGFQSVNCTGRFSWDTCSRSMDSTGIRCEEAAVVCQAADLVGVSGCEDGDVRLQNGSTILEGRLEVCVNRVWGTVCSSGFGQSEAKVACRKLSFASDAEPIVIYINSEFSPGVNTTYLELVRCNGNENNLLSCLRDMPLGLATCPHLEDVGLQCQDLDECSSDSSCPAEGSLCNNTIGSFNCYCGPGYTGNGTYCHDIDECDAQTDIGCMSDTCINSIGSFTCMCKEPFSIPTPGVGCQDTDECATGAHNCSMELNEVCENTKQKYRCVCPIGYDRPNDISVCEDVDECLQSFPCGSTGLCRNTIGSFACHCQPGFVLRGSNCECEKQHLRLVEGVISHVNTTVSLLNTTRRDNMFCRYRITAPSEMEVFEELCSSSWSDVVEGRVEICMNNEYQSVCDDRWDVQEARIVCQQLLHSSKDVVSVRRSHFGNGGSQFVLDNLDCQGNEPNLFACPKNTRNSNNCSLEESAGVRCGALCEDFSARILVGSGESYYGGGTISTREDVAYINDALSVGRIEICYQGAWRALCSSSWTRDDASVTCQQLGFAAAGAINGEKIFQDNTGNLPINIILECSGMESELKNCPGASIASNVPTCQAADNAYIICQTPSTVRECTHGQARLTGGTTVREGRLEICINGAWGTVCSASFFDDDASVACVQMNFERMGALYREEAGSNAQNLTSPIFLRNLRCSGRENSLLDCESSPLGIQDEACTHENDVIIQCEAFCPPIQTFSSFGNYSWNKTAATNSAMMDCEYYSGTTGSVSRICDEFGNWQDLTYSSNCITRSESILTIISSMPVSMGNVASVLDMLQTAVLMNTTEVDQTQQNRVNIGNTLDRIASCKCANSEQVKDIFVVLSSVNRWTANLSSPSNISVATNIEEVFRNLPGQNSTVNSPGITFSRLMVNPIEYSSSGLMYRTSNDNDDITGMSSAGSSSSQSGGASSSIILPGELFSKFSENLNIVFGVYETAGLFPRSPNGSLQIASSVVSTSVVGSNVSNLSEKVVITMVLESESYRGVSCVFWNTTQELWSSEGCDSVTDADFVGRSVTCRCNHLTTFAVVANIDPVDCRVGFTPNFDGTVCEKVKPIVTFASSMPTDPLNDVIEVGSGQEVAVECVSSGPFPGYAVWRKITDKDIRVNVTEIDVTNMNFNFSTFTFPEQLCGLLEDEVLGGVYAYRTNATRVVLGTRNTDVFGAPIGIQVAANGTYECFAENNQTNNTRQLHLKVLGNERLQMNQTYVRFNILLFEDIVQTYVCAPNSTQSSEFALRIIGTGVLNSLIENTATVSSDCTMVGRSMIEDMSEPTRISCLLTREVGGINVNQSQLPMKFPSLPNATIFIEEQGIATSERGFCDYNMTSGERGNYFWKETKVGETEQQGCFYEPLNEIGFASRHCIMNQEWNLTDTNECVTLNTYRLRLISRVNVTPGNAGEVVANISELLTDFTVEEQRQDNFGLVAEVYEDIGNLINEDRFNVTVNLTGDTVNVLSTLSSWGRESVRNSSSSLVNSYEVITGNLVTQPNFERTLQQESSLSVIAEMRRDLSTNIGAATYVLFNRPNETVNGGTRNTEAVISIPSENFLDSDSVVYSLYETGILFQVVPPANETETDLEVDTMVVGFTLFDKDRSKTLSGLMNPVILYFQGFRAQNGQNFSEPICVSWDFRAIKEENNTYRGNWTTEGCKLNTGKSNIISGQFVCECTHLTNFAVMVNVQSRPSDSQVLTIITIVGSVLSMVGLTLTIFMLLTFKKIRQKIITIFHIQLCIALFLMYLMFIIGILRVEHEVVCSIMSALIQYFALASVSWMGAEALLMLKTLVINVFYGPTKNFIIVTSVVCWVVPVLFPLLNMIITLSTNTNYMVTRRDSDNSIHYCFMSDIRTHIPLFLIPIYSVIIFNIVAFALVIKVFISQRKKRKSQKDMSSHMKTVASIFSVMIVYGIFWMTGVLNVRQAAVYFQWPFLILNVLQGVLIFILIGFFNTYKEWMALLSVRMKKEIKTGSFQNTHFNKGRSKSDSTKETSFIYSTSPRNSEDIGSEGGPLTVTAQNKKNEDIGTIVVNIDKDGDLVVKLEPEASLSINSKTEFD